MHFDDDDATLLIIILPHSSGTQFKCRTLLNRPEVSLTTSVFQQRTHAFYVLSESNNRRRDFKEGFGDLLRHAFFEGSAWAKIFQKCYWLTQGRLAEYTST